MSTQLATKETRLTVSSVLDNEGYRRRFEQVLEKRAPQFMSSLISISNSPSLRDTEPRSIIAAGMVAATLDLPINQNLGFAHIVAYKNGDTKVAQFQMGYKGYIQLALRTGQYLTINDAVIPNGVLVNYNELTGDLTLDWSKADHTKEPDGYALFFRLRNGFEKTVFWSHKKAMDHGRKYSKSFNFSSSGWKTNPESMCLKTVIAAGLRKYGLLSIELQSALTHDQGVQTDIDSHVEYVDRAETPPAINRAQIPAKTETSAEPDAPEPAPDQAEVPQPAPTAKAEKPAQATVVEPEAAKPAAAKKTIRKQEAAAPAAADPTPNKTEVIRRLEAAGFTYEQMDKALTSVFECHDRDEETFATILADDANWNDLTAEIQKL